MQIFTTLYEPCRRCFCLYTLPYRDRRKRKSVIISPQHCRIVGVRTEHSYLHSALFQRQNAIVAQQRHSLSRHVGGKLTVLLARHDAHRQSGPLHKRVIVKVSKLETGFQQTFQRSVDILFAHLSLLQSLAQRAVVASTFEVGARHQGACAGVALSLRKTVSPRLPEVAHRSAVTRHKSLKAPFSTQYLLQIARIAAARFAIDALIGTHHLFHIAVNHKRLERRQIGLPQVARRQILHIEAVAAPFRTAVHGKMLGTSQQFHIFVLRFVVVRSIVVALQSAHHGQSHTRRQIRVFAICLLSAPPARIAEYVYVGCPERQSAILFHGVRTLGLGILGTRLVARRRKHLIYQLVVPRCGHTYCHRKHCGSTVACHSVQRLVPPLELRYSEPRYGRRIVHHQRYFLLYRQS